MATELKTIRTLVNRHVNKILAFAEVMMTNEHFKKFRKHVLDEFGRSGLETELEREFKDR